MKALDLARILLLYPNATVLIDTMGDKKAIELKDKPYRDVRVLPSGEADESQVVIVVSDHGYKRAKR